MFKHYLLLPPRPSTPPRMRRAHSLQSGLSQHETLFLVLTLALESLTQWSRSLKSGNPSNQICDHRIGMSLPGNHFLSHGAWQLKWNFDSEPIWNLFVWFWFVWNGEHWSRARETTKHKVASAVVFGLWQKKDGFHFKGNDTALQEDESHCTQEQFVWWWMISHLPP